MRLTLSALLIAGVSIQAAASELDYRYYVTPGIGYISNDRGRLVDDGPELFVNFGKALSEKYNFEVSAFYGSADNETSGETDSFGLGVGVLSFVNRGHSPLYTLLRAHWVSFDGHPGADPDTPAFDGGLGLWLDTGRSGALRLEGGLRISPHSEDQAGFGGKKIYNDTWLRLGYAIAVGDAGEPPARTKKPVRVVEVATADSDGDGTIDDQDLCPGTPSGTRVDATGCAIAAVSPTRSRASAPAPYDCRKPVPGEGVDENGCAISKAVTLNKVNFEFDSAKLTAESKAILVDVAAALKAAPGASVEVGGHTSLEGDEYYNVELSRRRAESVRGYLVGEGVKSGRMQARGYGSSRPVASNETASGRRQNRRVEIKLAK